tara:strand:- start:200 stop:2374 length:2175 start_codon:yes stop_codon:yes gene_type:complete
MSDLPEIYDRIAIEEELRQLQQKTDDLKTQAFFIPQSFSPLNVQPGTLSYSDGTNTDNTFGDNQEAFFYYSSSTKWLPISTLKTPQMFGAKGDGTTDDTVALKNWLESSGDLYAPSGIYLVAAAGADAGGVTATISKSLNVICSEDAIFKAGTDLDNDVIRIKASSTNYSTTRNLSVSWVGGKFNQVGQKNSTVVPFSSQYTPANLGSSATCDGLSIRGEITVDSTPTAGFARIVVKNIHTIASNDLFWKTAGGDSGIFVSGSVHIEVSNSEFIGNRDLGIYASGLSSGSITGGSCIISNNKFFGCMFGAATKRLLSNAQIVNNVGFNTTAVATSTAVTATGDNIIIANNIGHGAWRVVRIQTGSGHLVYGNQSYKHGVVDPTNSNAALTSVFNADNSCVSVEGSSNNIISNNNVFDLNVNITHEVATVVFKNDNVTSTATTDVSANTILSSSHDLSVADPIYFGGITNTTGISNNVIYFVSETSFSDSSFRVTTDKDGAASGDISFAGSNDTSIDIEKIANKNFAHNNTADKVKNVILEDSSFQSREVTSWGNYGRDLSGQPVVLENESSVDKDGHILDFNGTYNHTGTTSTTNILTSGKAGEVNIQEDSAFKRDRIRITAAGTITGTNGTKIFSFKFNNARTQETAFSSATVGMWVLDGYIEINTATSQRIYAQITCNDQVATIFGLCAADLTASNVALEFRQKLSNSSDNIATNTFSVRWE